MKNIYLLLGREARNAGPVSSGHWCDFGGHLDPGETVNEAAAREFCEESLCAIDLYNRGGVTGPDHATEKRRPALSHYAEFVKDMIANKQYVFKLTTHGDRNNERHGDARCYFVIEVPWQPYVSERFSLIRSSFLRAKRLSGRGLDNTVAVHHTLRFHSALRSAPNGYTVNEKFLEKQQIGYWSLSRLEDVIRDTGSYKGQRFRSTFLVALRLIIAQLHKLHRPQQKFFSPSTIKNEAQRV